MHSVSTSGASAEDRRGCFNTQSKCILLHSDWLGNNTLSVTSLGGSHQHRDRHRERTSSFVFLVDYSNNGFSSIAFQRRRSSEHEYVLAVCQPLIVLGRRHYWRGPWIRIIRCQSARGERSHGLYRRSTRSYSQGSGRNSQEQQDHPSCWRCHRQGLTTCHG